MKTPGVRRGLPILLLLLAACAPPLVRLTASSKSIEWKRIGLPFDVGGSLLQPVWLYNPATSSVFVGANTKGLFESKDGGDSWSRVDDGSFVTSSVNTGFHTLQSGPNGILYSIDIVSGLYTSENGGRHWTKAFPLNTTKSRVWVDIDPDRPADVYLATTNWTESEPSDSCFDLRRSTNAGASFERVDIPACKVVSVDVVGRLVCYSIAQTIRCSDNGTAWQALSLKPIADSMAIDQTLNAHVELTINKTNRELVILSGGKLHETRNGRTTIARMTAGRTIDLVFDPHRTFPAYGISHPDTEGPWKLSKIASSGEMESYAGPKPIGFRLNAVDFARDTFYVWTGEGTYRGVLK